MDTSLYERDFYAWANEQAALLRAGKLDAADVEHIAEEIESMGRSEKRELINRLAVLLAYLLKWQFQLGHRGNSWRLTIKGQRVRLAGHLKDNPSLKSKLDDSISDAYSIAIIDAEKETGLDAVTFPDECPYRFGQITDANFWPENQGEAR